MNETLRALAYDAFEPPPLHAVRFLVQAAPRPAARTLDVGCGTGRVMVALVERGWPIVGIEPDEALRQRAQVRIGGRAAVVEGQLETLDVGTDWELVAVVNGPLSYVLGREARRDALARTRDALTPGGVLVLELPNLPFVLAHGPPPPVVVRSAEGWTFTRTSHREVDGDVFTQVDRFVAVRGEERAQLMQGHRLAVTTWGDLAEDLDHVGLGDHRTHRSLADVAPGPADGPRIVVVARR